MAMNGGNTFVRSSLAFNPDGQYPRILVHTEDTDTIRSVGGKRLATLFVSSFIGLLFFFTILTLLYVARNNSEMILNSDDTSSYMIEEGHKEKSISNITSVLISAFSRSNETKSHLFVN